MIDSSDVLKNWQILVFDFKFQPSRKFWHILTNGSQKRRNFWHLIYIEIRERFADTTEYLPFPQISKFIDKNTDDNWACRSNQSQIANVNLFCEAYKVTITNGYQIYCHNADCYLNHVELSFFLDAKTCVWNIQILELQYWIHSKCNHNLHKTLWFFS